MRPPQGEHSDLVSDLLIDEAFCVGLPASSSREALQHPLVQHQAVADGGDLIQLELIESRGQVHVARHSILFGSCQVVADDLRGRQGIQADRQGRHQ